jgi:hypothetical protein
LTRQGAADRVAGWTAIPLGVKDGVQPKDFPHQIAMLTGLPAREHRVYRRLAIGDLKPFRELADDRIAPPPCLRDMRHPATGRGDEAKLAANEGTADCLNVAIIRPLAVLSEAHEDVGERRGHNTSPVEHVRPQ